MDTNFKIHELNILLPIIYVYFILKDNYIIDSYI